MRLFLATKLPLAAERAAGALLAAAGPLFGPSVKWTRPENLHLTYAFLGETADSRLPALRALLGGTASAFPRVRAELGGLGAFPSLERPRVLWLGLKEENQGALAEIAGRLREGLPGAGREEFVPHVTLGRVKAPPPPAALAALAKAAGLGLPVELAALALYESRTGPAGPEYRELFSAPLL